MNKLWILAAALLFVTACGSTEEEKGEGKEAVEHAMEQDPPAKRDVSNETLVALDPEIQTYIDRVAEAKAAVKEDDAESQMALIESYVAFGDYMTYDSPVTPRQGKYHRALIEYRHALELDPDHQKAQVEIAQIEDIYRSMNRPIPGEE